MALPHQNGGTHAAESSLVVANFVAKAELTG